MPLLQAHVIFKCPSGKTGTITEVGGWSVPEIPNFISLNLI